MPTLFDAASRDALLGRVDHLTPVLPPRWGRFTAPEMVCHLNSAFRHALGETQAAPAAGVLAHAPFNWLAIHVMPWPKGKAKSPPEFLTTRPAQWDGDVNELRNLIRRCSDRGSSGAWPPHPVFGGISGRTWGALFHKHLDHHLRQFGV